VKVSTPTTHAHGRWAKWRLGGYWLLLALVTHWPNPWPRGKAPAYPDKLVHFAAYVVLAFFALPVVAGLASASDPRGLRRCFLMTFVALSSYGLLDETTQPLTGRDFEWLDWLADSLGVFCGLAIASLWWQFRTKRNGRC
jgi:VanZ family protein